VEKSFNALGHGSFEFTHSLLSGTRSKSEGQSQQAVADAMHIAQARVAELERDPTRASFGRMIAYTGALGRHFEPEPAPASRWSEDGRPNKSRKRS